MHGEPSKNAEDEKRDAEEIEGALTEVFEDDSKVLEPKTSSGGDDSVFIGLHASGSGTVQK